MNPFQTLGRASHIEGIGLHSGQRVNVSLLPRDVCGLVFKRVDLPGAPEIAACTRAVESTHHATVLRQGEATVSTTEHLMATLWAYGVTHATIELDGPEIPILDGSALGWCELLDEVGLIKLPGQRPEYSLAQPVTIYERDGAVIGLPHGSFRVTSDVEYDVKYLGIQVSCCEVTPQSFREEIASARTFTLESWIEPLKEKGLIRGGSPENAVVFSKTSPSSPLRFENEPARHKVLDAIGDIALMFAPGGGVLRAHIIAVRAGHGPHRRWMEAVLSSHCLQRNP